MQQLARRHIDRGYETELDELLGAVLLMGATVEAQFSDSVRAFLDLDLRAAQRISAADAEADRLEREIDATCVQLLARRQPMGSDLRFVTTIFKVVTDLERIGDLATGICERTLDSQGVAHRRSVSDLEHLAALARDMLHDALDSLVAGDVIRAGRLVQRDREIDEHYARFASALGAAMGRQPESIESMMRLWVVAKAIERVADHATSIAEMVVFMVDGRDVRHAGLSSR
jgi:phosphate transport system protein